MSYIMSNPHKFSHIQIVANEIIIIIRLFYTNKVQILKIVQQPFFDDLINFSDFSTGRIS